MICQRKAIWLICQNNWRANWCRIEETGSWMIPAIDYLFWWSLDYAWKQLQPFGFLSDPLVCEKAMTCFSVAAFYNLKAQAFILSYTTFFYSCFFCWTVIKSVFVVHLTCVSFAILRVGIRVGYLREFLFSASSAVLAKFWILFYFLNCSLSDSF